LASILDTVCGRLGRLTTAPFTSDNPDAEVYLHTTLKAALADAEKELKQFIAMREWAPTTLSLILSKLIHLSPTALIIAPTAST